MMLSMCGHMDLADYCSSGAEHDARHQHAVSTLMSFRLPASGHCRQEMAHLYGSACSSPLARLAEPGLSSRQSTWR